MNEAHLQNLEEKGISRRTVLKAGAAGLGALAVGALPVRAAAAGQPRIAVVGAGIAGLNAAWYLNRAGLRATVYEGSNRVGGRIWTRRGIMGPQLTTELGAEMIDSGHEEMLRLARRFGLGLLDAEAPSERRLTKSFYFRGRRWTEHEVVKAFRPIAATLANDQNSVEFDSHTKYNQRAFDIDHTPLSRYLVNIGAAGFIRELLNVAYLTEYGAETSVQSALNLVFLIGTETKNGFNEFGDSDQRYTVVGGADQITSAIARHLRDPVRLGHKLVAIGPDGAGYKLTFRQPSGAYKDVRTDYLLLTLPFSTLREVDISVSLPTVLRNYIDQCVYGTNSKLVLGFDRRYWRDRGDNGLFFTDLPIQSGWDSSRLQPGRQASLTIYTGGQRGIEMARGSAQHQRDLAMRSVNQVFPGANRYRNGKVARFAWPEYKWSKGSYSCFTTGQYTAFSGAAVPTGRMFFAGEHTSFDYQGYMEGGAVTGKEAAKAIGSAVRRSS